LHGEKFVGAFASKNLSELYLGPPLHQFLFISIIPFLFLYSTLREILIITITHKYGSHHLSDYLIVGTVAPRLGYAPAEFVQPHHAEKSWPVTVRI
jgi:hypothetical protein